MAKAPKITVFTPTYNREDTLPRLYKSIKKQNYENFEWLIIDDGFDDTSKLIKSWKEEARFDIRYYKNKKRLGKHIAVNKGLEKAKGEFFLIIDSDDELKHNTLSRLMDEWRKIPDSEKHKYSGVVALMEDQTGSTSDGKLSKEKIDTTNAEIAFRYQHNGEKIGLRKTDILKNNKYPEIENTTHIPETYMWRRITANHKQRYLNEILATFWDEENRSDRLTGGTEVESAAEGKILYNRDLINSYLPYGKLDPYFFFNRFINFTRWSLHSDTSYLSNLNTVDGIVRKILTLICFPLGLRLFILDKANKQNNSL